MGTVQPNTVIFGYYNEDKQGTMLARYLKSKAVKKFQTNGKKCTASEYMSMLKAALDLELNVIVAKG